MAQEKIVLVACAPDPLCEDVRARLETAGVEVSVLGTDATSHAEIAVLVLGGQRRNGDRARALITRLGRIPVLGIFALDDWPLDTDVVDCCGEYVGWPCDQRELRFRLQRMRQAVRNHGVSPVDDAEQVARMHFAGASDALVESCARIGRFARCNAPVLIEGETGTGKDLAARAIHYQSARRDHPFIPVNCGTLPDALVENELFGHAKDAYTGARSAYQGLVEQASGGSLFLDEVDALSVKGQVALLRFLDGSGFRRLGSTELRHTDVRIIAASNADLQQLVLESRFRSDLLFRLNILRVVLAPLRDRPQDLPLLAAHFLKLYCARYELPEKRLSDSSLEWMRDYHWPGNVRELENLIHRHCLLADCDEVHVVGPDVPVKEIHDHAGSSTTHDVDDALLALEFGEAKSRVIDAFEKRYLERVLAQSSGNVTLAAKRAGKERRALGRLMKKHGLSHRAFRHYSTPGRS